jgi:hypothetical protein
MKSLFGWMNPGGSRTGLPKEWVAVYIKLSGGEFGNHDEREAIRHFSRELDSEIQGHNAGVFDGDEYGNGECCLFMYGPNANNLFAAIEPLLRSWKPLRGGYAVKRYGSPDKCERIDF